MDNVDWDQRWMVLIEKLAAKFPGGVLPDSPQWLCEFLLKDVYRSTESVRGALHPTWLHFRAECTIGEPNEGRDEQDFCELWAGEC